MMGTIDLLLALALVYSETNSYSSVVKRFTKNKSSKLSLFQHQGHEFQQFNQERFKRAFKQPVTLRKQKLQSGLKSKVKSN